MISLDEVRPEDVEHRLQVGVNPSQLHLSPERLDKAVVYISILCIFNIFILDFLGIFQFHAQQVKPDNVSLGDKHLHLAYACLAARRSCSKCGMLVGMFLIDVAHYSLNGMGMSSGIVVKLLESPLDAVVNLDPISVHEIHAARHIVVMPSVSIHSPVGFHHLLHPLAEVGSLGWPSGTLALAG